MLHLICTFEPSRIPFLPQFTEHYLRLGAERFHLSLQVEPDTPKAIIDAWRDAAQTALALSNLQLTAVLLKPFSSFNLREHHDQLQLQHCKPEDWIIWVDVDEYQVYQDNLTSLLGLADSINLDYFRGILIDRISTTGELTEFNPAQPIWDQYPRALRPPSPISPSMMYKTVCARANVQMGRGNHNPVTGRPLRYLAETIDIHHFKWDSTVIARLSRRLRPDFKAACPWWVESAAILNYLESRNGVSVL